MPNTSIMVSYKSKVPVLMYGQEASLEAVQRAVPAGYIPKWEKDYYLIQAESRGGQVWVCVPLWRRPVRRKK